MTLRQGDILTDLEFNIDANIISLTYFLLEKNKKRIEFLIFRVR